MENETKANHMIEEYKKNLSGSIDETALVI